MTAPAPGARRTVETPDGRLVEQVLHPCGQWLPQAQTPRRGRTLTALALVVFVLVVLWAAASYPLIVGGLVLFMVATACALHLVKGGPR